MRLFPWIDLANRGHVRGPFASTVSIVTAFLIAVGFTGCGDEEPLDDVRIGDQVTVSADFEEWIGAQAIRIGGGLFQEQTLVLAPLDVMPAEIGPGVEGTVQVTGTVVEVDNELIQTELGAPVSWEAAAAIERYAGEKAILASSMQFIFTGIDADVEGAEPGERIVVQGEVQTVTSSRLFIIAGDDVVNLFGGEEVLAVVSADTALPPDFTEGATVEVVGDAFPVVIADVDPEVLEDPDTRDESIAALAEHEVEIGVFVKSITVIP